jgi:DNA-binding response OmpR family regulator
MLTLLIAHPDQATREFLAAQLDADGHTVHEAEGATATTAKLSAHAIDLLILADLGRPADTFGLLRTLRAGQLHTRVHPAQPVITLGASDELSTLRAYHAGSDHHLPADSTYLILRAVIDTVARRTNEQITSRHIHVEGLHIDTAARSADVNGTPIALGRKEFEILATLASDPTKVFSKDELTAASGDRRPRYTARAPSNARSPACDGACTTPAPTSSTTAEAPAGPSDTPHERPAHRTPRDAGAASAGTARIAAPTARARRCSPVQAQASATQPRARRAPPSRH